MRPPGYERIAWAYPRRPSRGPHWGLLAHFRYAQHGPHFDYFVVKRHRDGRTPFRRYFPPRCVRTVGHFGLLTVLERRAGPGC
jgi:hypothetical protein